MEGRDGGGTEPNQTNQHQTPQPTHTKTPDQKNPQKQATSALPSQKKHQANKQEKKTCSTKSQNTLSEDNLCGNSFLKIQLVPHSGIIKCLHVAQIQSFLWETEFKYTCDTNTIFGEIMILLQDLQTFKSACFKSLISQIQKILATVKVWWCFIQMKTRSQNWKRRAA